jgi:hypothetical protein
MEKSWLVEWYSIFPTSRYAIKEDTMKHIFITLLLLTVMSHSLAANVCNVPQDSAVIYFGNGVNASRESAISSVHLLMDNIGSEYNGQRLEFAVAYNQTGGIALDFLQSEMQLGAQFDSEVMLWLNGIGLIPDKVAAWYQDYAMRTIVVVAEEVAEHAAFYLTDILDGKKVVVVSHSQGNLYVNEAKDLLAKQLKLQKMESFKIFGVATPANNVGGQKAPYLTNNRDFIQFVPRALLANWKLFWIDKRDADDVGIIQAHLFNATYISDDFDIKPDLISEIKSQIDAAQKPSRDCNSFAKDILSMVAGHYVAKCGFGRDAQIKNFDISPSGMVDFNGNWMDLSGTDPSPLVTLGVNLKNGQTPISLLAFSYATRQMGTGSWNASGVYQGPGMPCSADDDTPRTALEKNVDIAGKVSSLLGGLYRLLPPHSCFYGDTDAAGNEKPIEFSANGSMVKLGNEQWTLVGESQSITTLKGASIAGTGPELERDFHFSFSSRRENTVVDIGYGRNSEIMYFSVREAESTKLRCIFNRESAKL